MAATIDDAYSPRMLAARVLSGMMPLEEAPSVPTAQANRSDPTVFRRRANASWDRASQGLDTTSSSSSSTGPIASAPYPARAHFQPYPKVTIAALSHALASNQAQHCACHRPPCLHSCHQQSALMRALPAPELHLRALAPRRSRPSAR